VKKADIKKLLADFKTSGNNIPGIFNYCDYWCERCPFTSRCSNFQVGEMLDEHQASKDLKNKEFWINYANLLAATFEFIRDKMAESGFDIMTLPTVEEREQMDKDDAETENDPLSIEAHEYMKACHDWCEVHFDEQEKILKSRKLAELTINHAIEDAFSVVTWYSTLIPAKISRALIKPLTGEVVEKQDADGSAKVALSGIDRSIAAYTVLYEHLSEYEDDILRFLVTLSRLKEMVLARFPDAPAYHRPGFDD